MRWKLIFVPVLALFFVGAALSAHSQVVYSAQQGSLPFTVGGGFSNFSIDWGQSRRMSGYTLWGDWRISRVPPALRGIGIEIEGRDINWGAPTAIKGHRMTTGSGGVIYEWRGGERLPRFRPYGKFLIGFGGIAFPGNAPNYNHDTPTVYEPGAGLNVRAWKQLLVRGEYVYQWWPNMFGSGSLTPNGFTVGTVYDFGRPRND
jgi:hypothetical protein